MAGKKPFFITGATAKVKVNGLTLAYCTNISYSVSVNHATPRVLGMYESTGIEPLSYSVTGSFSVVRYAADAKSEISGSPNGVSNGGNGIGNWGPDGINKRLKEGFNFDKADGRAYHNLVPRHLNKATGFEIYIYQKAKGGEQISVARIRDARITKSDFTLSKQSAAMQTFQFTAVYADEDSFLADFSGVGQQFS